MVGYFIAIIAGWAAALILVLEALLPYLLRRTALSQVLRIAPPSNAGYLRRLTPHYWLGYGIVTLAFAHASLLMGPAMAQARQDGLLAATLAIGLLLLQAMLGVSLQSGTAWQRRTLRNVHFTVMIALCALIALHIVLN